MPEVQRRIPSTLPIGGGAVATTRTGSRFAGVIEGALLFVRTENFSTQLWSTALQRLTKGPADCGAGLISSAQAYVFNATVVPSGALGYLSLWPDGLGQPVVSTLNALDGFVTSNMAIVPTQNGSIDAFERDLLDHEIELEKTESCEDEKARIVQIRFKVGDLNSLLEELTDPGVSSRTLFPDLSGLADFIRWKHFHKVGGYNLERSG